MCLDLWRLPRLLHNFLGGIPWIKSWNPTNSPLKPPVALSPWCIAAETAVTDNTVQPPNPPIKEITWGKAYQDITSAAILFTSQVFIPFCTIKGLLFLQPWSDSATLGDILIIKHTNINFLSAFCYPVHVRSFQTKALLMDVWDDNGG